MKKIAESILAMLLFFLFFIPQTGQTQAIDTKLAGYILLQVEANGEAWYVNPKNVLRYYLGRPADAFFIMRDFGVGIKTEDLNRIEIGFSDYIASDLDGDGLSDAFEDAIGSSKTDADTDNDGFKDKAEIENGYRPTAGVWPIDKVFAKKQAGRILLQVEANGEAWYVNPDDLKRYYLGRPAEAFSIMRILGLGISNSDLAEITAMTFNHPYRELEQRIHELVNVERSNAGLTELLLNDELAAVAREHSKNLAKENESFTGFEVTCDYPLIHHEGFDFGDYNGERLNSRNLYYFSSTGENIALLSASMVKIKYWKGDLVDEELAICQEIRDKWDSEFHDLLEKEEEIDKKKIIIKEEIVRRNEAHNRASTVDIAEIDWIGYEEIAKETVEGWMQSPGHRDNILTAEYDEAGIGAVYVNGYYISTQVFIKRSECGFQTGPCCEKEGFYPYCFVPLSCVDDICRP
ncbi:CAP domain-containing protein [bacterium]|nr:CAP domain-containing protein [bacterium]